MNNISFIKEYLEESKRNGISITNPKTTLRLTKPTNPHKYIYTLADILQESDSLEAWIKSLPEKGFYPSAEIALKRPNGSSYTTKSTTVIDFKGDNPINAVMEKNKETALQPMQNNNIPAVQPPVSQPYKVESYSPAAQQQNFPGMLGIPTFDFIEMKGKMNKLELLLEERREDKDTIKELKSDKRKLQQENASFNARLATADREREIAVKEKEIEQKSPLESPVLLKAVESLGAALPELLNRAKPAVGMGTPAANLSETKRRYIEAVQNVVFTDNDINFLHEIYVGVSSNEQFKQAVSNLLETIKTPQHGQ